MQTPTVSLPSPFCPTRWIARSALAGLVLLLAGCGTQKYTIDDGRKVNETLLASMRQYGAGERALRPAIARSASLHDPDCDTQWELPIAVASSYGWDANDRVAWVRALGVDERLTVTAALPGAGLDVGEKIVEVSGYQSDGDDLMTLQLADRRDAGKPFYVKTSTGKVVYLKPFKVCRGYARLAPPNTPRAQDYHWLLSLHPLEVPAAELTEDEALWLVLWGQGLSEEGGARMKTYHYGMKIAGTLYEVATIATGVKAAAMAAEAAVAAARSAAAAAATEVLKQQLIDQASAAAQRKLGDELGEVMRNLSQKEVAGAMQQAAANRGLLTGVARVAATVFDRADAWAFERMPKLGANPLAGASLHQKLIENGSTSNAFVFDVERLKALEKVARGKGLGEELTLTLNGTRADIVALEQTDMPLASKPQPFRFDDPMNVASSTLPYARGLIDTMLDMPATVPKP